MLQIARFAAIAICDSNRESQITSDLKGSALRFCCDLKKASNHKSRDLNCDLKRFWQRFGGYSCDLDSAIFSVTQRGGATKGGLSKCEQTQTNADKRRQTLTNASKRRGENASKRKQMRANMDKRKQTLTPPLYCGFLHPPLQPPEIWNH